MASVDPWLPLAGLGCLLFFGGWLLGRRAETFQEIFDTFVGAGIAFGALLASPLFFYLTFQQAGAKERLVAARLPVAPDFGLVVGAQGGRAPRNIWRFELTTAPEQLFADYERNAAAAGWKVERRKNGLLLTRDGTAYALWCEAKGDGTEAIIEPHPRRR